MEAEEKMKQKLRNSIKKQLESPTSPERPFIKSNL